MANEQPTGVTFETTLLQNGNNTGIEVPEDVLGRLGAGKRPPVQVTLNGHAFRTTLGVMGGRSLVPVSAAVRKGTGLSGGDAVTVTLVVADTPREVVVPDDLAAALADHDVRPFFDALSNSLQRFHVDTINDAKTPETRQRRIQKSVDLFLAGKKR